MSETVQEPAKPTPELLLKAVTETLEDRLAEDIVVINLSGKSTIADYMVIASGRSTRQSQSTAERITRALTEAGLKILGVEGERDGNWILIDAGSVVVHLFHQPVREFYEIEKLYGDAPCIEINVTPE